MTTTTTAKGSTRMWIQIYNSFEIHTIQIQFNHTVWCIYMLCQKYLDFPQIPTRVELAIYTHVVLYCSRCSCAYMYTSPSCYIMLPDPQFPLFQFAFPSIFFGVGYYCSTIASLDKKLIMYMSLIGCMSLYNAHCI